MDPVHKRDRQGRDGESFKPSRPHSHLDRCAERLPDALDPNA
jgi:hypothetical protein